MENKLKVGDKIFFTNDVLAFDVKAVSDRYAIAVRKLDQRHDDDLLQYEVDRGAYSSIEEAYDKLKGEPVYSIMDFELMQRAPNDRIFNPYDYWNQESIEECLRDLLSEEVFLSQRHGAKLEIDWDKTNKVNKNLNQ